MQMKILQLTSAIKAAAMVVSVAQAQTIGICTTKGGTTTQVTAAILNTVTTKNNLSMPPQPMRGTQQYIPFVNAGEIDFGVSSLPE